MKHETFIKMGGTQLAFAFGHERCKFFSGRSILQFSQMLLVHKRFIFINYSVDL